MKRHIDHHFFSCFVPIIIEFSVLFSSRSRISPIDSSAPWKNEKRAVIFFLYLGGLPIFRGKLASIIVGVLGRVFLLLFSELRISFSLLNARRISTGVEKLWVLKNRIKSISKEAIKVSVLYCHCIENRMNISVFDIIRFAI